MTLDKLYLFSKNTDAFSAQRGYNYQTLKTLETWVTNFIEGKKEDIYCEFEDDIFQKDLLNQKLTFRQIKLYSTNFSFSSKEIKKCICHFFTLHVKSDYNDFSKEFIFETNTNISNKNQNNEADLLKEWFKNQNTLTSDQLSKYANKVKEIVTEYIDEQSKIIEDKDALISAIEIFEHLEDSFWEEFSRMIKWKFIGTSPEVEFTSIRTKIEELIQQMPHSIAKDSSLQVFGVLLDIVFMKVTKKNEEQRKLTYEQFEHAILSIGNDEDKWYSRRYEYYKTLVPIDEFRVGEFYEILDLVNYCRRKRYLHGHKNTWNPFLVFYARYEQVLESFRRKAIYEMVFLNNEFYEVDYENLSTRNRPEGSLFGFEADVRFYFEDFDAFKTANDLGNGHNIICILFAAIGAKKINITYDELKNWFVKIYLKINRKLLSETERSEKCNLLELKGNFLLGINRLRRKSNTEFVQYFEQILELAKLAPLFKLSQFGDRIEKYIKMQINIDQNDEMGIIEALECFSEKLFPLVEEREGKVKLAQSQVKRGYSYLKTTIPKNLLNALGYFHKAKDNYLQEDTIEGYVLALMNIAQLYNSIGMHFAAKNYALAAFRMSTNKELMKRTVSSLAMLAYSDYKQGSWFNSLSVYGRYIQIRLEGNFDISDTDEDGRATVNIAFILYVMGRSSPQFKYLINNYIKYLDYVGDEIILPIQEQINLELLTDNDYNKAIENHIDDFPLNDIGKDRLINFYALGSLWSISFANTYEVQSVAEEYISAIQIVLAEIALSDFDFHLLKSTIEIQLVLRNGYLPPEQLPSNKIIKWKVYISYSEALGIEQINLHSAYNFVSLRLILDNISVLKSQEFETLFNAFFEKAKLDSKQIAVNLYQKIHRDIYVKTDLDVFQSTSFNKEKFDLAFPKENNVMMWNSSLSGKYNKSFSIEAIKNRFNNVSKTTYLTLSGLKNDPGYNTWLTSLRNKGWQDWQIMTNLHSYMLNYKVHRFEDLKFKTEGEYVKNLKIMMQKYSNMDEKDCFIEFPLEAFKSKEFLDHFNVGLPAILNTYGLETKLMTPNFKAIKEFLDVRFNLQYDFHDENNPLKVV